MRVQIDVKLTAEYDEKTKEFTVLSCTPRIINPEASPSSFSHILGATEVKYGILTLGSKKGSSLPVDEKIQIFVDGEEFRSSRDLKTHKITKGRVDGLTQFYKDHPSLEEGSEIFVSFRPEEKVLNIETK